MSGQENVSDGMRRMLSELGVNQSTLKAANLRCLEIDELRRFALDCDPNDVVFRNGSEKLSLVGEIFLLRDALALQTEHLESKLEKVTAKIKTFEKKVKHATGKVHGIRRHRRQR